MTEGTLSAEELAGLASIERIPSGPVIISAHELRSLLAAASSLRLVEAERDELRRIISRAALATGALADAGCSLEFLGILPQEIALGRARMQGEIEALKHDKGRHMDALLAAEAECDALRTDAMRYRWLRDDNGYVPEEESVRGGEELDRLCDEWMADQAADAAIRYRTQETSNG